MWAVRYKSKSVVRVFIFKIKQQICKFPSWCFTVTLYLMLLPINLIEHQRHWMGLTLELFCLSYCVQNYHVYIKEGPHCIKLISIKLIPGCSGNSFLHALMPRSQTKNQGCFSKRIWNIINYTWLMQYAWMYVWNIIRLDIL